MFPVSLEHGCWDLVQKFQQRTRVIQISLTKELSLSLSLSLSVCLSVSPTIFLPLSHNKDLQNICHFPGTILGASCILNHLIFTTTLWETASDIPIFPGQNWGINRWRNRSKGNSQDSSLGNLVPEFKLLGITISCLLINGAVLGGCTWTRNTNI